MRSTALGRDHLGIRASTFAKLFYVDSVEVIRRRYTQTTPCDENYKQEDDMIIRRLVDREGCSAPYWMLDAVDGKRPCTNASEMSKLLTPDLSSIDPTFLGQFRNEAPCSQIYGISYSVKNQFPPPNCKDKKEPKPSTPNSPQQPEGSDNTAGNEKTGPPPNSQSQGNDSKISEPNPSEPKVPNSLLQANSQNQPKPKEEKPDMCKSPDHKGIELYFKSIQYKEIKHIQAFNAESFIGNVGGYVGLFIGCAIWEAPDFIEFVYRKMRGWIKKISGFQNKQYFLDVTKE